MDSGLIVERARGCTGSIILSGQLHRWQSDQVLFIGREALVKAKAEGWRRRLCCFLLDEPAAVYGGEAIWHGGTLLGVTSSGGYGHTVQKSIVYGYVPAEHAGHAAYEIETFGRRVPAVRSAKAPYDPERRKILGSSAASS